MAERRRSPAQLFERARSVIPGGVNSPVRSFRSVGRPPVLRRPRRGRLRLGRRRQPAARLRPVLWRLAPRPRPSGRARGGRRTRPRRDHLRRSRPRGRCCWPRPSASGSQGCQQVRLVSSGTEAAMSAIRVARGFTGRTRIVKFAGCYHGHSDGLLAGGGSGVATLGLPDSAGVPAGAVAETVVAPYNLVPELDDRVACVIVEPVAANMGLVRRPPGFSRDCGRLRRRRGTALFDEVITGFRLGEGGASGWTGVTPDLWCFGKVIGGGIPVGAFGGRRRCPVGAGPGRPGVPGRHPVRQSRCHRGGSGRSRCRGRGLLRHAGGPGGPVRPRAGRRGVVGPVEGRHLRRPRPTARGPGAGGGSALRPVLRADGSEPVRNYDDAVASASTGLYPRLFRSMLARGVALAPGPYEVAFPSMAHGDAEFERTLDVAA